MTPRYSQVMKTVPGNEYKHSRPWTDDELYRMIELLEDDTITFREIGEQLGRSKNSCIGRMHRYIAKLEADRHARNHG